MLSVAYNPVIGIICAKGRLVPEDAEFFVWISFVFIVFAIVTFVVLLFKK